VSGIADPFNGHIDEFRIAHIQRSDGWIATTWNNMSNPGAFANGRSRKAANRRRWQALVSSVCLMGANIWHRLGRRHGRPLER
jgi:hypothetical protein